MCSIGGDFKCKDVLPPTPRTGRLGHTTEIVNSMSRRIVPRPTSSLNRKTNWRERIFLRRRAREMLFSLFFIFIFHRSLFVRLISSLGRDGARVQLKTTVVSLDTIREVVLILSFVSRTQYVSCDCGHHRRTRT